MMEVIDKNFITMSKNSKENKHNEGINREFQQIKGNGKKKKKVLDGNYRTEKYNIQNKLSIGDIIINRLDTAGKKNQSIQRQAVDSIQIEVQKDRLKK